VLVVVAVGAVMSGVVGISSGVVKARRVVAILATMALVGEYVELDEGPLLGRP